jgi:hypothetical protein
MIEEVKGAKDSLSISWQILKHPLRFDSFRDRARAAEARGYVITALIIFLAVIYVTNATVGAHEGSNTIQTEQHWAAKAIDLAIPSLLLARADEVIE